MCVIGNRNNSTGCPICFFSAFYLYDSAQDHRLRLLPIFNYCVLSNVSKMYLQPQKNAVNPLAVLFVFLFRFILPSLHLSPIAGIRGARWASACRGETPFVRMIRYARTLLLHVVVCCNLTRGAGKSNVVHHTLCLWKRTWYVLRRASYI